MRPVVISPGNPLRGDDAAAHSVEEDVKTATKDRVRVMKRTLPEISDILLQEYRPSMVFIVDACRLALPDRGFLISRVSGITATPTRFQSMRPRLLIRLRCRRYPKVNAERPNKISGTPTRKAKYAGNSYILVANSQSGNKSRKIFSDE